MLCRYGIVYSYFNPKRAEEYFEKCQRHFPNYPRTHYIRGIELVEKGDREGALASYKKAIEAYLPTDKYHLNEVWNNVGTIHYEMGQLADAKAAWERALLYLPSDTMVKENLVSCIYTNPAASEALRHPSPFVKHFMAARQHE